MLFLCHLRHLSVWCDLDLYGTRSARVGRVLVWHCARPLRAGRRVVVQTGHIAKEGRLLAVLRSYASNRTVSLFHGICSFASCETGHAKSYVAIAFRHLAPSIAYCGITVYVHFGNVYAGKAEVFLYCGKCDL